MYSVWEAVRGVSALVMQGDEKVAAPDLSAVTIHEVLGWCVIGVLAGSVLNAVSTKKPGSITKLRNVGIGVGAAIAGGWLSTATGIELGLGKMTINYDHVVAAVVVSVLVLFGGTWAKRRWERRHVDH